MKLFDKFLKYLKTDRNTFLTYILTLLTVYFCVDRLVEMLLMIFTGMSSSYWGPIQYTFALACPVFAFLFSGASKFANCDKIKLSFFDLYIIGLYIIGISMVAQWANLICWLLLISVPNYPELVANFSNLIKPAFSAIALYIPLTTFYPVMKWLITSVHDTQTMYESIYTYGGINLNKQDTGGTGAYSCEIELCKDETNGKTVKICEDKRFYQTLVVGTSGAGKTSLIFEPLIARDIDKKFFFTEISKEMGFTSLKTGLATLDGPYDNEYLNKHFSLNMLKPVAEKQDLYNAYMKKMIIGNNDGKYTYKNLGLTYMCPDYESMSRMIKIAKSYKLPFNVVDPSNSDSIGLNPFVFKNPIQSAIAISTILKNLYDYSKVEMKDAFIDKVSTQAVENVCILLKEVYPLYHEGELPTIEDLRDYLNDFDLIEAVCEKIKTVEGLNTKYAKLIKYFEKNFYKESDLRKDMEKYVAVPVSQIDTLLRYPGVKTILCNRTHNLNYDTALSNGEITFVCTRRGDLGPSINKAFGLFFILLMQYSVLRRPGTEKSRVPHFLYIDEFSTFISSSTEPIFTLYRKYKVATVISVQNLAQLGTTYKQTILSNCSNKIVFGNNTPEDNEWWSKEIGDKQEWDFKSSYNSDKGKYDPKLGDIGFKYKAKFSAGKIQRLKFKRCLYKIKTSKGKSDTGTGVLNFVSDSFSTPKKVKEYPFDRFINDGESSSNNTSDDDSNVKGLKNLKRHIEQTHNDDIPNEYNPIQTDTSDSKYLFDNEDAIVVNLKKKNNNNDNQ